MAYIGQNFEATGMNVCSSKFDFIHIFKNNQVNFNLHCRKSSLDKVELKNRNSRARFFL